MQVHRHMEKSFFKSSFQNLLKNLISKINDALATLRFLSLVFQRLVYKHFKQLIQNKLFNEQHGFCIGRSLITQLVYCDKLYSELEAIKKPKPGFIDIAKVFDTIKLGHILHKISQNGFVENFLLLFKSFLLDRQQRVFISNFYVEL